MRKSKSHHLKGLFTQTETSGLFIHSVSQSLHMQKQVDYCVKSLDKSRLSRSLKPKQPFMWLSFLDTIKMAQMSMQPRPLGSICEVLNESPFKTDSGENLITLVSFHHSSNFFHYFPTTCITQLSYCWDTISNTHNLKEELFHLAYSVIHFSPCSASSKEETS